MSLPKALIIDDETDIGDILGEFLEDNYECTVCEDPKEGLSKIESYIFDIIITDMNMPGYSGTQIIEFAQKTQPQTPVILLTGSSKEDPDVVNALSLGAKGIIAKPFRSPEEVIESLDNIIK